MSFDFESVKRQRQKYIERASDAVFWRHKKTGKTYTISEIGVQEADGEILVVYRGVGEFVVWVRPASEFFDGRFVEDHHEPIPM